MKEIKFTYLTFNTFGPPFKFKTKWRFEKIGQLLIKLVKERNVDFITLQETFHIQNKEKFILDPWKEEFHHCQSDYDKGKRLTTSGLTTLSVHPIVETESMAFSKGAGVDGLVNKGSLLTRLKLPNGFEMDVYNNHLQASYISQRRRSKTRIVQVGEMLEFVKKSLNPKNPVLVTGDLNIEEYNEEYTMLVDRTGTLNDSNFKFIDVMRQLYPNKDLYPLKTLRKSNPLKERKLDQVFIRPGEFWKWDKESSTSEVFDFNLSDHKAILSTIVFKSV